jgi:hypothetical protein
VTDDARLGLEVDGVGREGSGREGSGREDSGRENCVREDSAAELLDMLATLAFRIGPREGGCEDEGAATDCRLLNVVVLAVAGLGATTLEGRALGVVGGALALEAARGVGVGGVGTASEIIVAMLVSRMKRPWPGGQVKYRSPRTEPSFLPVGVESSIPTKMPSDTWIVPTYLTTPS